MVSEVILEGGALFVGGLAAIVLGWTAAYGFHMLRRIDQSAVETQTTETVTPPTK